MPGTIVVDQYGRRYANEAANYNDFGRSMQDFDPSAYRYLRSPSWMVFDATRAGAHPNSLINPATAKDWLISAPTIAELAEKIGVPARNLASTIATYNTYADLGEDPEFHRGSYARDRFMVWNKGSFDIRDSLRPLDQAPYYAVEVLAGCIGTKGGLVTDELARVVREDDSVIEGLFAAGNTAANGFGHGYPGGGGTIGPGLIFGWLAGETAAVSA
jgi:succinate dehydrogenase/fumarate reductase flavoprotein subunit